MEPKTILQKLKKQEPSIFDKAVRYYSVLSALNSLSLTERETQLVAFTAIKGNISYEETREEFCKQFTTSSATINNMVSKLKKTGILVKEDGKVKVNPIILLDFSYPITLQLSLTHG